MKRDTIFFDREAILDVVEKTGSTEGIFVVQLEGQFVISRQTHELARKYLPEYEVSKAEKRFETTVEMIAVEI